jgi:hypothetical protein
MGKQTELRTDEIMVRLLGVIAVRGLPQTQQIAVLNRIGLTPKAIAEIIGSTPNSVRVALFGIRKAEKQGRRLGLPKEKNIDEER